MKWTPIEGARIQLTVLPGWVLQLVRHGDRTRGVWTNGRSVWSVESALA